MPQRHRPLHSPASALDVLRESVRLLRADPATFTSVAFFLLCPICAALLAGSPFSVRSVAARLSAAAAAAGLPASPIVLHLSHLISSAALSSAFCLPLLASILLPARAVVAHAIACLYSGKKFLASEFSATLRHCWLRLLSTFVCACAAVFAIAVAFVGILLAACSAVSAVTHQQELVVYAAVLVVIGFLTVYLHAIVVCNVAGVIAALEESGGLMAMEIAVGLVQRRMRAGLVMFLGTTAASVFIAGLFEHRVKTVSYGDGSSRLWEGPLLVVMYAFVELFDAMMSAVYYFSCRSSAIDAAPPDEEEGEELLAAAPSVAE